MWMHGKLKEPLEGAERREAADFTVALVIFTLLD